MRSITLPAGAVKLSDNAKWVNRFEFEDDSSGQRFIIAQHRGKRFWGCTCSRWSVKRECRHLREFGLPEREMPYELDMILERQPVVDLDEMETISPRANVPLSQDPEVQRLLDRVNQRTAKLLAKPTTAQPGKKSGRRISLDEDV